ncbi:MAG: hypothetical protein AAF493_08235 [Pseudomonadota bacterium]
MRQDLIKNDAETVIDRRLKAVGISVTLIYVMLVGAYIVGSVAQDRFIHLPPNELAVVLLASTLPLGCLWLVIALFQHALEIRKNTSALLSRRRGSVSPTFKTAGRVKSEKFLARGARRPSFSLEHNTLSPDRRSATATFRNAGGTAYDVSIDIQHGSRDEPRTAGEKRADILAGETFDVAFELGEGPIYVVLKHRDASDRYRTQVFWVEVNLDSEIPVRVFER